MKIDSRNKDNQITPEHARASLQKHNTHAITYMRCKTAWGNYESTHWSELMAENIEQLWDQKTGPQSGD